MERHASILCPREGLAIINIGFGLGLIDTFIQRSKPRMHYIVEAHPDVYKHMIETGWDKKTRYATACINSQYNSHQHQLCRGDDIIWEVARYDSSTR